MELILRAENSIPKLLLRVCYCLQEQTYPFLSSLLWLPDVTLPTWVPHFG